MNNRRDVVNAGVPPALKSLFVIVIVILVAVSAASGIYHIVPPGHRGISITMGKVAPTFLNEGLNFKMPFITKVTNMEIRQRTTGGNADVFSRDLQNIQVSYNVLCRIPENKVVELFQQFSGDPYVTLVEPRVQEIIKQTTANYRAEELAMNRDKLKNEVVGQVQKALAGLVIINDITITNMQLSKPLEDAIEQKVIREQEALAKKFELDKANKDAEITLVKAKAEAESVKIKGEALKLSPEVIQYLIADKWDGKAPQSVVTTTGGANILLPLK
jgi:regulator of protease activity HflC (stomatin/prohibitin superfamily)